MLVNGTAPVSIGSNITYDLTSATGDANASEGLFFVAPQATANIDGSITADSGTVVLGGERIDRLPRWARAFRGIGRTHQTTRLFPALTVRDVIEGKPQGIALDLNQSGPVRGYSSRVVGTNDPKDTYGSDLVIVTAGVPRKR